MFILYHKTISENIRRLQVIAEHFGIESSQVDIKNQKVIDRMLSDHQPEIKKEAVIIDLCSISKLEECDKVFTILSRLVQASRSVLLLASTSNKEESALLNELSKGHISRIVSLEKPVDLVVFPKEKNLRNSYLGGYAYKRADKPAIALQINSESDAKIEMTLDNEATFASIELKTKDLFVWSTKEVFDIKKPISAELEFEQSKDEYIPLIIFLRAAYGDRCWHNLQREAGFVIDDPLLQKKYGFIDFPNLLQSARQNEYHITLAFIPWNYRRTKISEVKRFLDHHDCFSICIHGCDHNNNEYGLADYDTLIAKNKKALHRMEYHRKRTGVDCEPLFVCPQEKCSDEGWRAFADTNGILAMINTGCMPRNLTMPKTLAADLLMPAQDAFFGFPIFKRHYAGNMSPFALDLFLGKPAILVEHHEFFKTGVDAIEKFVRDLKAMEPDIKWRSLTATVKETCLQKRISSKEKGITFFTKQFNFQHTEKEQITYRLRKKIPDPSTVCSVLVNNKETDFEKRGEYISFELKASKPDQAYQIKLETFPVKPNKTYSFSLKYHSGVFFRRALSEFRDNTLVKNQKALSVAKTFLGTLGLTGKSNKI